MLGFSNIELIFEIIKNAEQFCSTETENKQALFIEHIIHDNKVRKTGLKIQTEVLKENASYFNYKEFNVVQSAVFEEVYNSDNNLLISAPTGAGKTDIAILSILRAFKMTDATVIYIVPMKALASEIFSKFQKLFKNYKVVEFTGDTELDSKIIYNSQIIICTPEKFDVATRRMSSGFKSIKLVIIDEIHLLEDDRGPVLEAIVARMFNYSELRQYSTRILGLSATLPNYKDVAKFIRAKNCYFFDGSYRPVPLKMTITGFTKIASYSNECDYLVENVQNILQLKKQVLVFVHSRAKTLKVGTLLMKSLKLSECNSIEKVKGFKDQLQLLAVNGIGVHHAGLCKSDRSLTERLFQEGVLKIIVCTSTLAWGVNLPAYCVIIHGSTYYNPLKGAFDDIGVLDVLQIFGRAGRPQYDIQEEAILMTKANKIDNYIKLLKRNQDIESKMLFYVPENVNAEIYLNNINSIASALKWIKNTFLNVRVLKNPAHYGILEKEIGMEEQALSEYLYLTIKRLEDCGMIKKRFKLYHMEIWFNLLWPNCIIVLHKSFNYAYLAFQYRQYS